MGFRVFFLPQSCPLAQSVPVCDLDAAVLGNSGLEFGYDILPLSGGHALSRAKQAQINGYEQAALVRNHRTSRLFFSAVDMKTFNNLYLSIITFENLLIAAGNASRGKGERHSVMAFNLKFEENLLRLREQLREGTYQPGVYRTFNIYDPKLRMISAAPFRDRVVHHALMNIVEPLLARSFIYDSYANRPGKGTHKAIHRFQEFLRSHRYLLKCDIKSYFPTIDHQILKSLIRKRIMCKSTLWLMDTIIDGSNPQQAIIDYFTGDTIFTPVERRKGLPLGNLTSQFFANYYLNPLDHYVKEMLKCKGYLRYVDDFVLFSDNKDQLWYWKTEIRHFLESYRLKLQPRRCQVIPTEIGCRFLGQYIYRTHRRLASDNVRRFRKRKRKWDKHPPANLKQCLAGWIGHARRADTNRLLKSMGLSDSRKKNVFHSDLDLYWHYFS